MLHVWSRNYCGESSLTPGLPRPDDGRLRLSPWTGDLRSRWTCLSAWVLLKPQVSDTMQFLFVSVERVIGRGCHEEDKSSQKEGGEPGWTAVSVGERSESF